MSPSLSVSLRPYFFSKKYLSVLVKFHDGMQTLSEGTATVDDSRTDQTRWGRLTDEFFMQHYDRLTNSIDDQQFRYTENTWTKAMNIF